MEAETNAGNRNENTMGAEVEIDREGLVLMSTPFTGW